MYIFEFASDKNYTMSSGLLNALSEIDNSISVSSYCGFLKTYKPGGMGVFRILNMLCMFTLMPIVALILKPDVILVRSAPPGIQIFAVLAAKILSVPVVFWLMDYHPEIEARYLQKHNFFLISRFLRTVDRWAMRSMKLIIALDEAMADLCRLRVPNTPVLVHPTWQETVRKYTPCFERSFEKSENVINLGYFGNLGVAHDLDILKILICEIKKRQRVSLVVVNVSSAGRLRFKQMSQQLNIDICFLERVPELRDIVKKYNIDYGIVLMSDSVKGLLSPSKFMGYIGLGLPLIYIGPEKTNAWKVVHDYGAGISIQCNTNHSMIVKAAGTVVDMAGRHKWAFQTERACDYFVNKNGHTLARAILPYIKT